ncbi:hypothetical protein [Vibrio crassostreae]|uniref:hypothetical protein n=1 Tax=Vibrio crassostreae TaxID=246167 RepID=UPI001B313684|nr:hypothetical protein [Vibrio crassostreae]
MSKKDLQELLTSMASDVKTTYSEEVVAQVEVAEQQFMDGFYLLNLVQLDDNHNVIARSKGVIGKNISEEVTKVISDHNLDTLVGCTVSISGRAIFSPNQDFSIFISGLEILNKDGVNRQSVKAIIDGLKERGEFTLNKELETAPLSTMNFIYHASEVNQKAVEGFASLAAKLSDVGINLHPVNFKKAKGGLEADIIEILKGVHASENGISEGIIFLSSETDLVDAINLNKSKIVRSFARIGKPVFTVIGGEHEIALREVSKSDFGSLKELIPLIFNYKLTELNEEVVEAKTTYKMSQCHAMKEFRSSVAQIYEQLIDIATTHSDRELKSPNSNQDINHSEAFKAEYKAILENISTHIRLAVSESITECNLEGKVSGTQASDSADAANVYADEYKAILGNIRTGIKLIVSDGALSNDTDGVGGNEDSNSTKTATQEYVAEYKSNLGELKTIITSVVKDADTSSGADEAASKAIMEQNYTHGRFKDSIGIIKTDLTALTHKESDYGCNRAENFTICSKVEKSIHTEKYNSNIRFLAAHLRGLVRYESDNTIDEIWDRVQASTLKETEVKADYTAEVDAIHLPEGELHLASLDGEDVGSESLAKGDEIIISSPNTNSRVIVVEPNYKKTKKGK